MSQRVNRRSFTVATAGLLATAGSRSTFGLAFEDEEKKPVEAAFTRDYDPPTFKPKWAKPQINRQMVQDFVIYAHSDLKMVEQLLNKEPGLLNSTMDWGQGDWETGLGGASHMGRKDIVKFLLSKGARIDIFCAAMMGMLDAVKSMLTLEPALIDAKGPHGFSLHFHAQVGVEDAKPVLDYLQTVKHVELKPIPFLKKSPDKKSPDKKSSDKKSNKK